MGNRVRVSVQLIDAENDRQLWAEHLLVVPSGLTVPTLKLDPVWDSLRKDPRFQALIEKYATKT